MYHPTIRLQYACFQPLADEAQKGFVVNPLLQQLDQLFMVDFVKVAADIGLDQEVIAPASQLSAQVPNRI